MAAALHEQKFWEAARVAKLISEGAVYQKLSGAAQKELSALSDIQAKVVCALTDPKPLDICMPVLNAVLAAQYYEVFEALKPPKTMKIYEPCVGASNPVIAAAAAYSDQRASYLTINLN